MLEYQCRNIEIAGFKSSSSSETSSNLVFESETTKLPQPKHYEVTDMGLNILSIIYHGKNKTHFVD